MQAYLISQLVKLLVSLFVDKELLKKFVDLVLDFAENYVLGTSSTVDDDIVLPLTNALRDILGVPDADEPPAPE
jgi:hypothetical protein